MSGVGRTGRAVRLLTLPAEGPRIERSGLNSFPERRAPGFRPGRRTRTARRPGIALPDCHHAADRPRRDLGAVPDGQNRHSPFAINAIAAVAIFAVTDRPLSGFVRRCGHACRDRPGRELVRVALRGAYGGMRGTGDVKLTVSIIWKRTITGIQQRGVSAAPQEVVRSLKDSHVLGASATEIFFSRT